MDHSNSVLGPGTPAHGNARHVPVATTEESYALHSSGREKVLEHVFIAELLRTLWMWGIYDAEVLRSEVDASGYDLAIECRGVMRHIQLKSSASTAKTARVNIHTALAAKPSGCVIWMKFDPVTLTLGPFFWLGGAPSEPLPPLGDKVARHAKGDGAGHKTLRPRIRVVARQSFVSLETIGAVAQALFGLPREPAKS